MSNEELRTNNEGIVEAVDAVVTNLPTKSNVGTIAKIAIPVGIGIAAGIGLAICKVKGVFEKRSVERLKKKGYVIYKNDEIEIDPEEDLESLD